MQPRTARPAGPCKQSRTRRSEPLRVLASAPHTLRRTLAGLAWADAAPALSRAEVALLALLDAEAACSRDSAGAAGERSALHAASRCATKHAAHTRRSLCHDRTVL